MGFTRGRRPRRDRSRLLDSQQPDECHTSRFVRPSACRSRVGSTSAACSCAGRPETRALAGSRPYRAGSRAPASALAWAPGGSGGRSPAPSRSAGSDPGPSAALCSAHRRAGAPTSACSRPTRRSAAAARARTGDAGSPRRIRAQEPRAAGRGLGLFRGGLRPAFRAARRRLGLSAADRQVRPGRDCRAEEDPSAFRYLSGRARLKRKARSR
jgi:hypothetical protein